MPAERTRGSKRAADNGVQLTWSAPVGSQTAHNSFAFAPNVTPGTFHDQPSSPEPVVESALFPSTADATASSRRHGHTRKKPDNHIPRPPNAFILFRSSFIKNQHVSSEVETNHSTLSKIIGLTWQSLPHEERQIWHAKAKLALDEHRRKWPQYAFRPLHTKAKGAAVEKRKVREVGLKDMKRCAKIAELLVEGKKGQDLDAAIQEFDRHHVPEIVTRFETPITARSYRRSSSAPVPDTEHSSPAFLSTSSSKRSTKLRASSSKPEIKSAPSPSEPASSPSFSSHGSDSEYQGELYSEPSSPFIPSPTYELPAPNPSFDFNTFSFSACDAMPMDSCDPLAAGCEDSYQYFANTQTACSSQTSTFDTSSLSIDTNFFDNEWTTSSSPLSSVPGTPHSYSDASDPMVALDVQAYQPIVDSYNPPQLDFFSQGAAMSHNDMSYCMHQPAELPYGAPEFASKNEFSSMYERRAVPGPVDCNSFQSAFMASSIPGFIM